MTKLWNDPHQWDVGELNSHTKMQAVSDGLEWLKDRPYDNKIAVNVGSNIAQATTGVGNWFAANDALFTINITTAKANERVLVLFEGVWSTSGALSSSMFWDVLLDDTTYASTGTGSSANAGLGRIFSAAAANVVQNFSQFAVVVIPTAGVHTLKLRIGGTNATTVTLVYTSVNDTIRFSGLDI